MVIHQEKPNNRLWILGLVSAAIALRAIVSLHPYSGQNKPPMFGDYEAQRHWQEITVNHPITDWYHNTTSNDLQYWGLDYPPLTAYHSYLLGIVAGKLNSSFVALHESRGIESEPHKNFMRLTVLIADIFVYIPAIVFGWKAVQNEFFKTKPVQSQPTFLLLSLAFVLCYPGQILIDNGHFQYNNISLGLAALAVAAIINGRVCWASCLFSLALNYKQMELYHALPFFFYLLGVCIKEKSILKLIKIGASVCATFLILWLPWMTTKEDLFQLVHRIFPVARGVFEDKVSNVWCALNIVIKFKEILPNERMAILCFTSTIAATLPTCIHLIRNPTKRNFMLAMINSSLAFFLFSFQVHEKSILLAALPVLLYFPIDPLPSAWFLSISTFSMAPLLLKDGLVPAYFALTGISLVVIKLYTILMENIKTSSRDVLSFSSLKSTQNLTNYSTILIVLRYLSLIGSFCLLILFLVIPPPTRLPDLFPLLISVYSCAHFVIFFLYFNYKQLFA